MAKRYTDTEKWRKPFIKSLPTEYKLFFLFLLDDCDHAGIWHTELDVAEARLGVKLSLERIRGLFKERVVEFDGGTKMFIPDFIEFQYGILNPANKVHKSVIEKLVKYDLLGLTRGLQAPMDKAKEMDKEKEEEPVSDFWTKEAAKERPMSECMGLALKDEQWVGKNKTKESELEIFNDHLTKLGVKGKTLIDYKSHFSRWKDKNPDKLKTNGESKATWEARLAALKAK